MGSPGDGSLWGRAFYAVGYLLEEMEVVDSSKQNAADADDDDDLSAIYDDEGLDVDLAEEEFDEEEEEPRARARRHPAEDAVEEDEDEGTSVGAVIGASAGAWLVAKLLSPRPISWPRALAAGLTGTALAEIVGTFERRLGGSANTPLEDLDATEMLTRYVAGVGAAAVYGSLFYPRIPGAPLVRGLVFGAVEAVATPAGGIIAFIRRIAPHQPGLLENLATSAVPGGTPASSLAFGLGLGLLYRPEDDDDDDDDDD